jgi:hypothetical protein
MDYGRSDGTLIVEGTDNKIDIADGKLVRGMSLSDRKSQ